MSEKDLREPVVLKVKDIEDLARFVASVAASGQPIYVLRFPHSGKHIYGMLAVYHDYYDFYGMPLFYYYESDREIAGKYLVVKSEDAKESVSFSDGIKPGWIGVPVIALESAPPFLRRLKV